MDDSGGPNLLNQFADKTPQDQAMENRESYQTVNNWNQLGFDEKKVAVDMEMKRMNQLPANSTYATHRLKVLNKVLQLLTIQVLALSLAVACGMSFAIFGGFGFNR